MVVKTVGQCFESSEGGLWAPKILDGHAHDIQSGCADLGDPEMHQYGSGRNRGAHADPGLMAECRQIHGTA